MRDLLHGFLISALLTAAAIFLAACSTVRQPSFAITHITVIDGTAGPPQPDMTVVVTGTRILAIGPYGATTIPTEARIVDATGKFLIPGLSDMHVHLTGAGEPGGSREFIIPLLVANGVTTVRDMGGNVELLKQLRREIDSGKRIGPEIFFTGPYLDGNPPSFQPSIVVQNVGEASAAVDRLWGDGVDFLKVQSRLQPGPYFAIARESRKLGARFVGHVPDSITAAEAAEAGQASIEHLTGILLGCSSLESELRAERIISGQKSQNAEAARLQERLWLRKLLRSIDRQKTDALVGVFARNRTWQVPTFPTLIHIGFVTLQTDLGSDWRLRYVPRGLQAIWTQGRVAQLEGYTSEDFALRQEVVKALLKVVGQMYVMGVPIMGGTDTAAPNVFPGFSLHEDLQFMVKAGLTPAGALQAATVRPAEFLRRTADQGTIQAGKRADLVVLDEDPLAGIENTTKIRAVVLNGKFLDRRDLDRLLGQAEQYAAAH